MKNIVVLISGQGSNLQALLDACQDGRLKGRIAAVLSNNPDAYGLVRAQEAGIPAQALLPSNFASRADFDAALAEEIARHQPDVVVLAGYMRILSEAFVRRFSGKMLNIHPSLLPKYPGLHTHRKALENGDSEHGTSVHFVTEELDGGPVILQARVPIFPEDSEQDVQERVQAQEHSIYPLVVSWYLNNRLALRDNRAWLDGVALPAAGYAAE
ncbi:phosphoribosylglycinamide formyltransferase [Musicola paradisiaca]|uniref:Phosphoribosylglycinamide formyltransferase n=1 Tax=Musicola paradisiaca (strain Ech703) TaxID=579405 RepID=C6CC57_MUSP7|nr:phosphoribosylglycinamide formyltransferase [Musicola paradisiaca]ACS84868.1 phosphoribosylglycinamide formyltransferase [Musicola paradisiaca Ech703]